MTLVTMEPHGLTTSALIGGMVAEHFAKFIDGQANALGAILNGLETDAKAIESDRRLSGTGRAEALTKRAGEAVSAIGKVALRRKGLDATVAEIREAMPTTLPIPINPDSAVFNQVSAVLRAGEIRARLESLDPIERVELLRLRAEAGDLETLHAADAWGEWEKVALGIDPTNWGEILATYWRHEQPEAHEKMEAAKSVARHFNGNLGTAYRAVEKSTGVRIEISGD